MSQHSTLLMKELNNIKHPITRCKDNFIIANSIELNNNDNKNKENIVHHGSHMIEKPLTRPKRSMKVAKN